MTVSPCKICDSPLRTEIESKDSAWKADQTIKWAREKGVRVNRTILARHRAEHLEKTEPKKTSEPRGQGKKNIAPLKSTRINDGMVDDLVFLDAIKERAYEKLLAGEFDLKIESAFKAIEIKHKLSDESSNEKLLLEILSEIRADELKRIGRKQPLLTESA
ncbi:MAG: hypothetical protein V3W18_01505 [candidate division Zixibacteria bacterium]